MCHSSAEDQKLRVVLNALSDHASVCVETRPNGEVLVEGSPKGESLMKGENSL